MAILAELTFMSELTICIVLGLTAHRAICMALDRRRIRRDQLMARKMIQSIFAAGPPPDGDRPTPTEPQRPVSSEVN